MIYSYSISHVPGEDLHKGDTLSQAPVHQTQNLSRTDKSLIEDTNIYVDSITDNVAASPEYLNELRELLKTDNTCASYAAVPGGMARS